MSATKDIFADYPQTLSVGTGPNSSVYTRLRGFYAIHGWRPDTPGAVPVQTFEEDAIALLQGEPEPARGEADSARGEADPGVAVAPEKLSPVYALQSGGAAGSMAVPTGRVFIRFADGVGVGNRESAIRNAGYEVDQKVDYAPNAAWLRARSGSIADALNGIETLRKIADVENVEPQMLMQASYR